MFFCCHSERQQLHGLNGNNTNVYVYYQHFLKGMNKIIHCHVIVSRLQTHKQLEMWVWCSSSGLKCHRHRIITVNLISINWKHKLILCNSEAGHCLSNLISSAEVEPESFAVRHVLDLSIFIRLPLVFSVCRPVSYLQGFQG